MRSPCLGRGARLFLNLSQICQESFLIGIFFLMFNTVKPLSWFFLFPVSSGILDLSCWFFFYCPPPKIWFYQCPNLRSPSLLALNVILSSFSNQPLPFCFFTKITLFSCLQRYKRNNKMGTPASLGYISYNPI